MQNKPDPTPDAAGLRRRAEGRLREQQRNQRSEVGDQKSEADTQRLVHELQVHQIELEMQQEGLRQARDDMETELEKYSDLYDFSPVGYLTLDREGAIREANLTSARLLGMERSRLLQRRFGLYLSPSDLPAFNAFRTKVFESKAREVCEVTLLKQGKPPVGLRIEAVAAASGRECRAVLEDITDRKRAEKALRESEEWCRTFFENSSDGLFCLSPSGEIVRVNQAFARMHGYTVEELLSKTLPDLDTAGTSQLFAERMSLILAGHSLTFEVEHYHKDGHAFPLEVTASMITMGGKKYVLASHRDITERKRSEEKRLILNKLESTGILAGGIAHDFNNLLTVILMNLDLAQALLPPGEESARRLEEAKRAAMASRGLTQQLITFAKGGGPVRRPTRLAGVIQESVRPALSGSRVRCEFSLAGNLWLAEVDQGQFGQVIRNLVQNAREAMPEGGVVSVRAENVVLESHEIASLPPGEYVRVSIADQGVGIAKEVLPKIFDPYFSTKQRGDQKGMGLGLTICHTVIQKHGGGMAVESELGTGTAFHIYLPASRKLVGKEPPPVPKVLPRHGRFLVMDDEEGVRNIVTAMLQRMEHEVESVPDGQKAIEVYERAKRLGRPFDLVLLDLTVRGGMGGQEAIRALLRLDPAVKAIVMSGYAHDPVLLEPERHSFQGALEKPFDRDKLQETLSRVMGQDGGSSGQRSEVRGQRSEISNSVTRSQDATTDH